MLSAIVKAVKCLQGKTMDRMLKQGMILIDTEQGRDTLIIRPNGVFSCLLQSCGRVQRSLQLPVSTAETILDHLESLQDEEGNVWQVLLIYRDGRTVRVCGPDVGTVMTKELRTFLETEGIHLSY